MKKRCSKCNIEKHINEFNNDNRPSAKFGKRPECRDCGKIIRLEYYSKEENKVKKKKYLIGYTKNNLEKVRTRRNKWFKKKINEDILFRLSRNLRNRIHKIIKNSNLKTDELIGVGLEEFKLYLESKFQKGMTWENYGDWHIDHIIPLSSGKNEHELYNLCHYTNLQPLWKLDNIKKSNKILW